MAKLKLDLHAIFNKGQKIDLALKMIVEEAVDKKIAMVDIITGKGSGALRKKVLRFLQQKEIRALYFRIHKDQENYGRIFVEFRFK